AICGIVIGLRVLRPRNTITKKITLQHYRKTKKRVKNGILLTDVTWEFLRPSPPSPSPIKGEGLGVRVIFVPCNIS
ncbi:MAG: hypothetical protein ACK5LW_16675, partial [Pseudanabaena sp.]